MSKAFSLRDFLLESNRIEGIAGVRPELVAAAEGFLVLQRITTADMVAFVAVAQPNAVLREWPHLNVRVGNHIAPRGGDEIVERLDHMLMMVSDLPFLSGSDCYEYHHAYETLHPFTDGNGRSGRILWLWMMGGIERAPLGFLHHWYYQSLSNSRALALKQVEDGK